MYQLNDNCFHISLINPVAAPSDIDRVKIYTQSWVHSHCLKIFSPCAITSISVPILYGKHTSSFIDYSFSWHSISRYKATVSRIFRFRTIASPAIRKLFVIFLIWRLRYRKIVHHIYISMFVVEEMRCWAYNVKF